MNNPSKPQSFKVPTPYGHLWLIVGCDGSRWVPIAHLCEVIGVPLSDLIPRIDKGWKHWGCEVLDAGCETVKLCLPLERVTSLLHTIKDRQIPPAKLQAFHWLQKHAYSTLHGFRVPEPQVPLFPVEPEPEPKHRPVVLVHTLEEKVEAPVLPLPVKKVEAGLQTFNFGAMPVRVVMREGEPWWFAAEVCAVMEISNVGNALARLDDDEKSSIHQADGTPGNPNRAIVSESGLYNLIIRSDKPEAKSFKRWVTHEVIPSIRKTGSYGVQTFRVPTNLREALHLAAELEDKRMELACKVDQQQATISVLEPKAEFHDRVTSSEDCISIREFAKVLGNTGQNRFYRWLREKGYVLAKAAEPYQKWVDAGLFVVIEKAFEDAHGFDRVGRKTLITGKGQVRLQREWDAA